MLAGVSTEYYSRLERGDLARRQTRFSVRSRVLFTLMKPNAHISSTLQEPQARRREQATCTIRPSVRPSIARLLNRMTATPAYVRNARFDIVTANPLCFALYAGIFQPETLPFNLARFVFLEWSRSKTSSQNGTHR